MTEKRQILKFASVITLVAIMGRICGYIHEQRVTLLLGAIVAAASLLRITTLSANST